jgi:hypothetical protein
MSAPTYDGLFLFGGSVQCQVLDNPNADQLAAFFGIDGQFNLFGGTRGRVFAIQGVLIDTTPIGLAAQESVLRSYRDGISRTFVDTKGAAWDQVLFRRYQPEGRWYGTIGYQVFQPYKAMLEGML